MISFWLIFVDQKFGKETKSEIDIQIFYCANHGTFTKLGSFRRNEMIFQQIISVRIQQPDIFLYALSIKHMFLLCSATGKCFIQLKGTVMCVKLFTSCLWYIRGDGDRNGVYKKTIHWHIHSYFDYESAF